MYIRMNTSSNNNVDYLSLLNPPVYTTNEEPRYVNIPSRDSPEPEENVELKPMLRDTGKIFFLFIIYVKPCIHECTAYSLRHSGEARIRHVAGV